MSGGRRVGAAVVAVAATLAIAAGSRAPAPVHPGVEGRLRVAIGARPERVEVCRRVDPEDLARLPAHMRREVICEGRAARYRLEVRRDGTVLMDAQVLGGGARHDRPLHVSREWPLTPGPHHLMVRLVRLDSVPAPRPGGIAIPPDLVLALDLTVAPRRVILVTYDPGQRRLVATFSGSLR